MMAGRERKREKQRIKGEAMNHSTIRKSEQGASYILKVGMSKTDLRTSTGLYHLLKTRAASQHWHPGN